VTSNPDLMGAIAATRLGLGARPGELGEAAHDPRGYLLAQIRRSGADQPQPEAPSTPDRVAQFDQYRQMRAQARAAGDSKIDAVKMAVRTLRDDAGADFLARIRLAASTDAAFRERWALFWANHFTVSAAKPAVAAIAGPFEQEAIRPRVFGRFEDLLIASSSHPAMLIYLDQVRSLGPDSLAGRNQAAAGKPVGLNENLAREIMELHSVGVDAGYSQADVTEFARAMTGWSIGGPRDDEARRGRFEFHARAHEPGERRIMGRTYADGGDDQARAVMRDLAASPHTARRLALKIARHFVADAPPPSLVDRLATRYQATGGDLGAVAETLVTSPETWAPEAMKFKTPYEFMVSSWRATGREPEDIASVAPVLTAMGQKPFGAPSPKGWAEEAEVWCAPDAVIKRMSWSEAFAGAAIGEHDPVTLAQNALGPRLTPIAAQTIARAETRAEGLSILLMSPEFQRR
jgi:uncharacterized protein (DUF1800 family)